MGLRPPMRLCLRANSRPDLVRARSIARSDFGNGPTICIVSATGGRCGVDSLGQAPKPCLHLGQPFHDREHVSQRTGEAVQFPYTSYIALAELVQQPMKLGRFPPAPDAFSRKMRSHPAVATTATWAAVSFSFIETRA